jgi:hypothetical protein
MIKKIKGVLSVDAEKVVKRAIELNPGICRNRSRALELLFGMIGTGLHWVDGEVQDCIENNYLNSKEPSWWDFRDDAARKVLFMGYEAKERNEFVCERMDEWAKMCAKHNSEMQVVLDNIDIAVKTTPTLKYYYPLCDLSIISKIPDNVKPDWLILAEEFCLLVLKTDINYKSESLGSINKKNHEYARKALERIKELRK